MDNSSGDLTEESLQYPQWQRPLQLALLELDKDRLKEKVASAEAAIFARLQELSLSENSSAERQSINDGIASLRVLKRNILDYPDWEK